MNYVIPDDILETGLDLQEAIKDSILPSTVKAANTTFDGLGSVYFLMACIEYKKKKESEGVSDE